MKKRYIILIPLTSIALLMTFWAPIWIDRSFREASSAAPMFFDKCRKAWAHRGFVGKGRENTVGSVRRAIERGATGVEVDILYDVETGRFMVSHNRPYQQTDGNILTLDQLFSRIEADTYYWLDAKDLSDLWPWQAKGAVKRLTMILEKHGLKERALVESRSPFYLAWLADHGIHTSYMVSPNEADYSAPIFWGNIYFMKLAYTLGPFSALSMNDDRYTRSVEQAFGSEVPILVSTVNNRSDFEYFAENPRIKIVLSDRNFYSFNNCKSPRETQAPSVQL